MADLFRAPGTLTAWKETFEQLKKLHDEAYVAIDEGLLLEQEEKKIAALTKYNLGLSLINKALAIQLICPANPNLSWERANIMVENMKKSKREMVVRIADLKAEGVVEENPQGDPPSYEEAISGSVSSSQSTASKHTLPLTYRDLADALNSLKQFDNTALGSTWASLRINNNSQVEAEDGEAVVFTHDNVLLYFISPDGSVTSTSQPQSLQIVKFSGEIQGNRPAGYLQVGDWIYPLVPGVSPCFRSNYRAYIFPDIHSDVEGAAVGIILPEIDDFSVYELLECILQELMMELPPPEDGRSARMRRDAEIGFAHSVVRGARYVSSRLIIGAERAGQLMNRTTPKLLNHLQKETPADVDPNVSKSFQVARDVSGKAVVVTGFLASKVGQATCALGRFLAPHIQEQGTRLLTSTLKMEQKEAKDKMDSVLQITAGAVEAFGTVYSGLYESAGILSRSLADNTVKVIHHKYGANAGQMADNTFGTMGNVFVASNTLKKMTPINIAKISAKETGKAVIEDQRRHLREHTSDDAKPLSSNLAKTSD